MFQSRVENDKKLKISAVENKNIPNY